MVKKVIAVVLVVLAIVLFGGIATSASAHAATNSPSVSVAKSAPTFVAEKVSPSTSLVAPKVIGGGVIRPTYVLNNCYTTMFGETWCYRSHCTYFDVVILGCYWGWVKINRPWYA